MAAATFFWPRPLFSGRGHFFLAAATFLMAAATFFWPRPLFSWPRPLFFWPRPLFCGRGHFFYGRGHFFCGRGHFFGPKKWPRELPRPEKVAAGVPAARKSGREKWPRPLLATFPDLVKFKNQKKNIKSVRSF